MYNNKLLWLLQNLGNFLSSLFACLYIYSQLLSFDFILHNWDIKSTLLGKVGSKIGAADPGLNSNSPVKECINNGKKKRVCWGWVWKSVSYTSAADQLCDFIQIIFSIWAYSYRKKGLNSCPQNSHYCNILIFDNVVLNYSILTTISPNLYFCVAPLGNKTVFSKTLPSY